MTTPAQFKQAHTLAEFLHELEAAAPEHERLSKKTAFLAGAIAMWMLARHVAELEPQAGVAKWGSITNEIEELGHAAALQFEQAGAQWSDMVQAAQSGKIITDGNTDFFEREMLPRVQQVAAMAKSRGMSMLAAFEVTTSEAGVQLAQLLLPGPGGRVSSIFAQALGIINGTSAEEALKDAAGEVVAGRSLH